MTIDQILEELRLIHANAATPEDRERIRGGIMGELAAITASDAAAEATAADNTATDSADEASAVHVAPVAAAASAAAFGAGVFRSAGLARAAAEELAAITASDAFAEALAAITASDADAEATAADNTATDSTDEASAVHVAPAAAAAAAAAAANVQGDTRADWLAFLVVIGMVGTAAAFGTDVFHSAGLARGVNLPAVFQAILRDALRLPR